MTPSVLFLLSGDEGRMRPVSELLESWLRSEQARSPAVFILEVSRARVLGALFQPLLLRLIQMGPGHCLLFVMPVSFSGIQQVLSYFIIVLYSISRVRLCYNPRDYIAHQSPLSMGFARQEYWSGLPFPSPGDILDPGIEPRSPAFQVDTFTG